MKYVLIFLVPFLLLSLYGSCNGGGGDQETINRCFSLLSKNPCFDSNEDGTSSEVEDKTVDEVIQEQENRQDFLGQLDFNEIVRTLGRSIFLPPLSKECRWEDSGLVIKTQQDWNRYRNNCYFQDGFIELPDVDFSERMVIVSLDGSAGFGTEILKVLEFDSELVTVVTDTISDVSSFEAKLFGSFIVEVPRRDKPVSFIRVEEFCNSILNFGNSECLAESMLNRCEFSPCSFPNGNLDMREPNCEVLDCTSVSCEKIEISNFTNTEIISGIITDIELGEGLLPQGIINLEDGDKIVSCFLVVE